jgi:hypothetical protein
MDNVIGDESEVSGAHLNELAFARLDLERAAQDVEVRIVRSMVMPTAPLGRLGCYVPDPAVGRGERLLAVYRRRLKSRWGDPLFGCDNHRFRSHCSSFLLTLFSRRTRDRPRPAKV